MNLIRISFYVDLIHHQTKLVSPWKYINVYCSISYYCEQNHNVSCYDWNTPEAWSEQRASTWLARWDHAPWQFFRTKKMAQQNAAISSHSVHICSLFFGVVTSHYKNKQAHTDDAIWCNSAVLEALFGASDNEYPFQMRSQGAQGLPVLILYHVFVRGELQSWYPVPHN